MQTQWGNFSLQVEDQLLINDLFPDKEAVCVTTASPGAIAFCCLETCCVFAIGTTKLATAVVASNDVDSSINLFFII